MPELPEVESLRLALARQLVGSVVREARLLRADMLHREHDAPPMPLQPGGRVTALHRHGKQLVIESPQGGCLLVHLGMSGSLRLLAQPPEGELHVHAWWRFDRADGTPCWLRHRDPRRFGWLESHVDTTSVHRRCWSLLGPDALHVSVNSLTASLRSTRRPLKAALLDQSCVAGLGNIYVDEALFRARLHPATRTNRLRDEHLRRLAGCIRATLRKAVELGGSTIQDHRTADGTWGSFQRLHRVYGRANLPCKRCGAVLTGVRSAQRATVFCATCQPRRPT